MYNMGSSESIIKLNVGGQIFQTSRHTLTKHKDSLLGKMFKSPKNGSHFIQKIEEDNFFLDADPEFFRIILNWLRLGKITTENPEILNVVQQLSDFLGLAKLVKELKEIQEKTAISVMKNKIPELVTLLYHDSKFLQAFEDDCQKFVMRKSKLTRVPESLIARFFMGEEVSSESPSFPIAKTIKPDEFVSFRMNHFTLGNLLKGIQLVGCSLICW